MKTKAIVIVLVVIAAVCEAFFNTELVLQRAKRRTNAYSEFRRCVDSCKSEFNETIQTMKKGQIETVIPDELLSEPKLDAFCRNYERMDSCITDCVASSGDAYRELEQMFDLFSIICKSRSEEFVSYLPCFSKSKKLMKEQCVGGCGEELNSKMRTGMRQFSWLANTHQYSNVNIHLSNLCDFLSCHSRCQARVLKESCPGETGENAGKFIVTFAEQAIKAEIWFEKSIEPQIILPEDCLTREGPFPSLDQANESEGNNDENEDNFFF